MRVHQAWDCMMVIPIAGDLCSVRPQKLCGAGARRWSVSSGRRRRTGNHRLFLRADKERVVNESDEGNNDAWRDVYVGFRGAHLVGQRRGERSCVFAFPRLWLRDDQYRCDYLRVSANADAARLAEQPVGVSLRSPPAGAFLPFGHDLLRVRWLRARPIRVCRW